MIAGDGHAIAVSLDGAGNINVLNSNEDDIVIFTNTAEGIAQLVNYIWIANKFDDNRASPLAFTLFGNNLPTGEVMECFINKVIACPQAEYRPDPNYAEGLNALNFLAVTCVGSSSPEKIIPLIAKYRAAGVDIDAQSSLGATPLKNAIGNGNFNTAKALIECGANVDGRDIYGETPLFWAIMSDNQELVNFLLARHADINVINKEGETPLVCAIKKNNKEIVAILLKNGANINQIIKWRYFFITPLGIALIKKDREIVEMLLIRGANFEEEFEERDALFWAIEKGYKEIIKILLDRKKVDVNCVINAATGDTSLICAVRNNSKDIVAILLAHGANVNVKNKNGETSLSVAPNREIKDLLLSASTAKLSLVPISSPAIVPAPPATITTTTTATTATTTTAISQPSNWGHVEEPPKVLNLKSN